MSKPTSVFLGTVIALGRCACTNRTPDTIEHESESFYLNARVVFAKAEDGTIILADCEATQKNAGQPGKLSYDYGYATAKAMKAGASAPDTADMERVVNFNGDSAHFISETLKICAEKFAGFKPN